MDLPRFLAGLLWAFAATLSGLTAAACAKAAVQQPAVQQSPVPQSPVQQPSRNAETSRQQSSTSYVPRHRGHIDLSTGLYIRVDEDLVVPGAPPLILRRTYLSNYRASMQFGIGTRHDGEWFLIGDGERFQWAELVRANGSRVRFERSSPGTSLLNAKYQHRATSGEWGNARLQWAWVGWALRREDGHVFLFKGCGPHSTQVCSIVKSIDPQGHEIVYRRDARGRLLRMEADPDRWIAFDYDYQNRITRAYDQAGREVRYEYDTLGRLIRVDGLQGRVHRYQYTDRDELATIVDPGTTIENSYDQNGRCIRQVNRFPGDQDPFIFDFSYRLEGNAVVQSDTRRSDGTWTRYTFDPHKSTLSEAWGMNDFERVSVAYERDPSTNDIVRMTVACVDGTGIRQRHSSVVGPGNEEETKRELVATHCY